MLSGTTKPVVVVPVVWIVPVAIRDTQVVFCIVPGAAPLVVPPREKQQMLPCRLFNFLHPTT
jgi:hypothetical protein